MIPLLAQAEADAVDAAAQAARDALNASRDVSELAYLVMGVGILLIVGQAVNAFMNRPGKANPDWTRMVQQFFDQLVLVNQKHADNGEAHSECLAKLRETDAHLCQLVADVNTGVARIEQRQTATSGVVIKALEIAEKHVEGADLKRDIQELKLRAREGM